MEVIVRGTQEEIAALAAEQERQHGLESAVELDAKAVAQAICGTGQETQENT